jgi:2-keto-4-pentenoate hydratase/2-oxohepta-3-ene-1,7-dioic acid hydratase in catechol pathway
MKKNIRLLVFVLAIISMPAGFASEISRYVRYEQGNRIAYGILGDEAVGELSAAPWDGGRATGKTHKLADVKLLAPVEPSKVIAAGKTYQSHIGQQKPSKFVSFFAKLPSCIVGHEADIVYPSDATNLHYEGELVIVIGKQTSKVSPGEASAHVFGVTIGNDVSERDWQRDDMQWLRAKAADTFGPLGPWIVTGIDHRDLLLETRVNGKTVQSQRTKDLMYDIPHIVSHISQYITLLPGDVIYTGTPGTTSAITPGDVVEVEIEKIGVLRNRVVASKQTR